jgi:peptidyl-prolyl cis-trans isomerase C
MNASRSIILLSLLLLAAMPVLAQAAAEKPKEPTPAPAAAGEDRAKQVLAKMGDKVVTVGDIEEELSKIPPQFISHFSDPQRKQQYIQSMVDRMVFAEEAKAKGFMEREDVKKKIDSYVERILYSEYLKTLTEGITVTDAEAAKYYEEHKNEFMAPEKIKVKHILVKSEEEAANIKSELDKGADWDELAKKYSTDKNNAARGGDLGYISRGRMAKEFDEGAFSLEIGKIGGPVKTQFGYHLIKMEDKKPAELQTLEQVDKQVRNKLLGLKREQKMEEMRKGLQDKYHVVVNWDKVGEIKVGSGAPGAMPPGQGAMPVKMEPQPRVIKSEPMPADKKEPEKK